MTPRGVKRLINVYKVLKILWARPNNRHVPEPQVERAIVLLLALSCRYPDMMRDALEGLRGEVERSSPVTFTDFFQNFIPPAPRDAFEKAEWQRLLDDLVDRMPPGLAINALLMEDFDLVRSFSFVGDIGYEPGDFAARRWVRRPASNARQAGS